jgi:diaminohydroxyphosphoribosylaminopyrimidine deaminase/5-amino-6-(5-phosphoribosylamino)uracil reductase
VRVTLKLATSLDGRIATATGESRWITGEAARTQVHKLRAVHGAVLVGVATAIADDPELTVRLPGYVGPQPTRVVLDTRQRLPLDSKLVKDAGRLDTVVITAQASNKNLAAAGATVLTVDVTDGRLDLPQAMSALEEHLSKRTGVRAMLGADLFVEGGGQVAASFLSAGLVDAIEWFRAPIILGDEGRPAVGEFVLQHLKDAPRFRRAAVHELGDDLWERYERG